MAAERGATEWEEARDAWSCLRWGTQVLDSKGKEMESVNPPHLEGLRYDTAEGEPATASSLSLQSQAAR